MLRIAHISPQNREQSSSFIKAHLRGINGHVVHYHGGYLPTLREDNIIAPLNPFERIIFKFYKKIKGLHRDEYRVLKQFKKDKIQLIFAEYGPTGGALTEISKLLKIPLIVHFHGYDVFQKSCLKKNAKKYELLFIEVKGAIAVSKEMKQELCQLGIDESKIIYSPCGCEEIFLTQPIPSKRQGLIAVGRFVEKKGPLLTIKAFEMALKMNADVDLIFIGDGPLLAQCKEYVKQNNLENHIRFLGNLPHDSVVEKMSEAAIFVQHSVTASDGDREGTPVSVMEAQALGLPVISTLHAGIPDVVIHEKTGVLVEENDIAAMSEAILKLSGDPSLCAHLGLAGRKRIAEKFTVQHHLNNINTLLRKF